MSREKSKYELIYGHYKQAIKSGQFTPDTLLPTDNQMAEEFNASRPTVARAVNRLVEEGILGRRAGYGTFVLDKSDKALTFGLLIPGLGDTEIFEPICGQIAALAADNNFVLIWSGGGQTADKARHEAVQLAERLIEQNVDGVFFTPIELIEDADKITRKILRLFKEAEIAVVLLDSDIVDHPLTSKYDLIGIDNVEAGYTVTKHLVEQGCKTMTFLTRSNVARTVAQRLTGARAAIDHSNLNKDALSIHEISDECEELADQLSKGKRPDGIVCYNDATAARLMTKLVEKGINIPRDILIVGIDDVKYASMLSAPLTTYHQPCEDIGKAAVKTMLSRVRDPQCAPIHTLLKGELVVRKSSGS